MVKLFKNSTTILLVTGYWLLVTPLVVYAAGLVPCGGELEPECQLCHFFLMAERIIDFLVWRVAIVLAIFFTAWAGIMFIIGAENEQKRSEAKGMLWRVFLGILIIFASWAIIDIILQTLADPRVFPWNPWNEITCPIT